MRTPVLPLIGLAVVMFVAVGLVVFSIDPFCKAADPKLQTIGGVMKMSGCP